MYSLRCVVCVSAVIVAAAAAPSIDDGRWIPQKFNVEGRMEDGRWIPHKFGEDGSYKRPRDEGKYIHVPNPYLHIHNPYDGGYGPYTHQDDPYKGEETIVDQYKLILTQGDDNPFYKEGYYRNNGIKIIKQKHNYDEDKYDFLFETENKIRQEEKAALKNANTKDEGIASSGFYEYIGPDGFLYRVDYTADENGFRPKQKRIETPYSGKWQYVKVN